MHDVDHKPCGHESRGHIQDRADQRDFQIAESPEISLYDVGRRRHIVHKCDQLEIGHAQADDFLRAVAHKQLHDLARAEEHEHRDHCRIHRLKDDRRQEAPLHPVNLPGSSVLRHECSRRMGDILLRRHCEIIHPVDRSERRDKCDSLHIHDRLHADLAQLHAHLLQGARNAVVKCAPQDRAVKHHPFSSETEERHLLLNIDQTAETAQRLTEHRSHGASRHAPLKDNDKEQVPHHIEECADDQEIKRNLTVPQRPQCIRKEIIDKREDQPHKNDPQIDLCRLNDISRNLQKLQQRMSEQDQKDCDHR